MKKLRPNQKGEKDPRRGREGKKKAAALAVAEWKARTYITTKRIHERASREGRSLHALPDSARVRKKLQRESFLTRLYLKRSRERLLFLSLSLMAVITRSCCKPRLRGEHLIRAALSPLVYRVQGELTAGLVCLRFRAARRRRYSSPPTQMLYETRNIATFRDGRRAEKQKCETEKRIVETSSFCRSKRRV